MPSINMPYILIIPSHLKHKLPATFQCVIFNEEIGNLWFSCSGYLILLFL